MPLKLFQAEQNTIINWIPKGKAIALTGDNNKHSIQLKIANGDYIYIFTNLEIALLKKFKKNVLNNLRFAERLGLVTIDEIYLVEQWGKNFKLFYAKIEKIR